MSASKRSSDSGSVLPTDMECQKEISDDANIAKKLSGHISRFQPLPTDVSAGLPWQARTTLYLLRTHEVSIYELFTHSLSILKSLR